MVICQSDLVKGAKSEVYKYFMSDCGADYILLKRANCFAKRFRTVNTVLPSWRLVIWQLLRVCRATLYDVDWSSEIYKFRRTDFSCLLIIWSWYARCFGNGYGKSLQVVMEGLFCEAREAVVGISWIV